MQFEKSPPEVALATPITAVGRHTPIDIDIRAGRQGLKTVRVQLRSGEGEQATVIPVVSEEFPAPAWFEAGITEKRLHLEPDLATLKVPEGTITLEVFADTYAWHFLSSETPRLSAPLKIDLTPPRIELLTSQHNLRLGGAELALFRLSEDTERSGVAVEDYFFPSVRGYFADPNIALAFFAVPQNLDTNARVRVVASDAAGNQREMALPCKIAPQKFAERSLNIDDSFLQRKMPEMDSANHLTPNSDLVQGYLYVNRELRQQNEKKLKEITSKSKVSSDWDLPFHRQTNAAPLSSFADRRTYLYGGKVIDHQTHLGYDLASLKLAAVEATQNGTVVFADNLGIYGNTVVLDHGLGIFSLYGHMSSLGVKDSESVKKAQSLGQSGETGLAGGDHIHYSIMLWGTHIDPIEWWDSHWLKDHVTGKLAMFPRAQATAKQ